MTDARQSSPGCCRVSVSEIRGTTRVFGIIGRSLSHSLSPVFWNAAFGECGIDAVYVPFPVIDGHLEPVLRGLAAAGVAGVNITMPFKEKAASLVTEKRAPADILDAVNTVRFNSAGEMEGTNTDAVAILSILRDHRVSGPVTLLGAGGAAKAVMWSLCQSEIPVVYWGNRTASRLVYPASLGGTRFESVVWEELSLQGAIERSTMVINATTLGWKPQDRLSALEKTLGSHHLYLDLNYAPGSRLLAAARRVGATVIDGLEVLIRQGMSAFSFLTGQPAPEAVMRASLKQGDDAFSGVLNSSDKKKKKELRP